VVVQGNGSADDAGSGERHDHERFDRHVWKLRGKICTIEVNDE
jgi:hypothetical protein